MTISYLVRHGETAWNADGRFQGHQNVPLNDAGRAQATRVAQALTPYRFAALYSSDLARAWETAEIIAAKVKMTPVFDPRLRENFFGEWEGYALPEINQRWPDTLAAWRADPVHTRPPGGETLEELQARVTSFFRETIARHPEDDVAIIGHGGSVRAIIALALGADMSIFRRVRLDNCSISIVRAEDEQYTLMRMNEICHLGNQPPRATWDEAGDQWRLAFGR